MPNMIRIVNIPQTPNSPNSRDFRCPTLICVILDLRKSHARAHGQKVRTTWESEDGSETLSQECTFDISRAG